MKYCPRCKVVYMDHASLCEYCPETYGLPPRLIRFAKGDK